jgi:glucose/arabinose dehydrogenase
MSLAAACGGAGARAADAAVVGIGAGLHGPSGLQASVYANGLENAAALAFDDRGRLWVATANYEADGRDGVFLVTDRAAAPVSVIPNLRTPLGLLWQGSTLYVASGAGVEAFTDFDGTTFAARRTVVTLPTDAGQPNGLVMGPDGRLHMGISAPCDHCTASSPYAGSVVSFRPDGGDLQVEASGMRAPVGLAYVPGTADLLATMNQRDDLGDATPGDWLAQIVPGQDWGFPECYGQGGAACAGTPSPVAELDPHAAVSGVAIVDGRFVDTAGPTAIVAEWALGTVQVVTLARSGSGWVGGIRAAITGIERPVPVLAGPDGAVFVGDWATGVVYRLAAS